MLLLSPLETTTLAHLVVLRVSGSMHVSHSQHPLDEDNNMLMRKRLLFLKIIKP